MDETQIPACLSANVDHVARARVDDDRHVVAATVGALDADGATLPEHVVHLAHAFGARDAGRLALADRRGGGGGPRRGGGRS